MALAQQLRKPSGFFGKIVARMMNARNANSYSEIIRQLELKGNESLFEIGYGTGRGIRRIMTAWPGCRISGIDFSELMHNSASSENKSFIREGKVNLHLGDFLDMPAGNEKFDRVYCLNVIYFWNSLDAPFSRIYSMLCPGGSFLIYMDHRDDLDKAKFLSDFSKYSIEDVESALKKSGFSRVEHTLIKGYFIKAVR